MEAPQGYGPVTWPALTENELNYMWFHLDEVEPRINYRQKEMAFFRDYMSYIVQREILMDGKDCALMLVLPLFIVQVLR